MVSVIRVPIGKFNWHHRYRVIKYVLTKNNKTYMYFCTRIKIFFLFIVLYELKNLLPRVLILNTIKFWLWQYWVFDTHLYNVPFYNLKLHITFRIYTTASQHRVPNENRGILKGFFILKILKYGHIFYFYNRLSYWKRMHQFLAKVYLNFLFTLYINSVFPPSFLGDERDLDQL